MRRLRSEAGRTLVDVAEQAGISQPFLSQIERGRASPSMATLDSLARVLGTTQGRLLSAHAPTADGPGPIVLRADRGETLPRYDCDADGGRTRMLHDAGDGFQVAEFLERPGPAGRYFTHPESEWIYVVRGHVKLDLEGCAPERLGPGDSAHYAAGVPHRWYAVDCEEAVLLAVKSL